jgi:hypothetical protein
LQKRQRYAGHWEALSKPDKEALVVGNFQSRSGPEMLKAPASCIDYGVTHERGHAVHGHHGKQFYELLRRVMPDWEERKVRLERMATN